MVYWITIPTFSPINLLYHSASWYILLLWCLSTWAPWIISAGFKGFYLYSNFSSLLSFQSPHSRFPSHQEQTQQLASPTPSPALLLPREDSLGHPLYSGRGQVVILLLLVEASLWAVHHLTPSPSTHYGSPMMDSTPARPLFGLLLAHHQLHSLLQVIENRISTLHNFAYE